MPTPRQKVLAVTPGEKSRLDDAKRRFEEEVGQKTDWGGFLATISVLGLAALGIYKLVRSSRANPVARCPVCLGTFSIATIEDVPLVVYVACPHCRAELVVDFREE